MSKRSEEAWIKVQGQLADREWRIGDLEEDLKACQKVVGYKDADIASMRVFAKQLEADNAALRQRVGDLEKAITDAMAEFADRVSANAEYDPDLLRAYSMLNEVLEAK